MSKALLHLLGRQDDKKLQIALHELEASVHTHTIDTKIVGDILHAAHALLREMGLDSDVTAKEMYQALRVNDIILTEDVSFVGLSINDEVVSCNAKDIASDESEMRQFNERHLMHFRDALAEEIVARYKPRIARPKLVDNFLKEYSRTR